MKTVTRFSLAAFTAAVAFALAGCDSLLGIRDHELAPDASVPVDGSAGSSGGDSGSSSGADSAADSSNGADSGSDSSSGPDASSSSGADSSAETGGGDAAGDAPNDGGSDSGSDASDAAGCIPANCPTNTCAAGACVPVTQLAEGGQHSCALLADGTVRCWGNNGSGQVGDGTTTDRATPTLVGGGLSGVTAIGAGAGHTCAVLSGGTVRCWGNNGNYQLGNGATASSSTPVAVLGIANVTQIAASGYSTCALLTDGSVQCWGSNAYGQIGDGTTAANRPTPTPVAAFADSSMAVEIAAGADGFQTCARLSDGTVECWGNNASGQIGNGNTTNVNIPTPVTGLTTATQLAVGGSHCCAVTSGGNLECWGNNSDGQLGDGSTTNRTMFVTAKSSSGPGVLSGVAQVTAGDFFTCARIFDGSVDCWGDNRYAQTAAAQRGLGIATPGVVAGLSGVAEVRSGGIHACARLTNGAVDCWGMDFHGQLGVGTITAELSPTPVAAVSGVAQLDVGGMASYSAWGCALLGNQTVSCWGNNDDGQLGDNTTTSRPDPRPVKNLTGAAQVASGIESTCALLTNGTVSCWGSNGDGQLGNNTTTSSSAPVSVLGLPTTATQIALGEYHACALLADTTVSCWGANGSGQLGDGTTTERNLPVPVSGLTGVASLGTGSQYSCAVMASDGSVRCWGANGSGQLGDGTQTSHSSASAVPGLSGVLAVGGGSQHTCALLSNHTMSCWGSNSFGQLGVGSIVNGPAPAPVTGISGISGMFLGYDHTCALLATGVSCWGDNAYGQVGDGTTVNRTSPTAVSSTSSVAAFGHAGCGPYQTCTTMSDGSVDCWGFYQGIASSIPAPVVWP